MNHAEKEIMQELIKLCILLAERLEEYEQKEQEEFFKNFGGKSWPNTA